MNTLLILTVLCVTLPLVEVNSAVSVLSLSSRITDGFEAKDTDFPWHVSIIGEIVPGITQLCSGSLISADWILTAAHCTRGMLSIHIGIGSTNLSKPIINYIVYDYIIHPDYDNETKHHDVSLVQLPEKVQFGPTIQPILLARRKLEYYDFQNTVGRVSGFGRLSDESPVVSQLLKWIYVRIIDNQDCQRVYGEEVIVRSTICAVGLFNSTQNTCGGDSGGALVVHDKGKTIQIGVIAFQAKDHCTSGFPGGYMRVTSYVEWISKVTGIKIRS